MPWFPTKARVAYAVVGGIFMQALRKLSQVLLDFSHRFRAALVMGSDSAKSNPTRLGGQMQEQKFNVK